MFNLKLFSLCFAAAFFVAFVISGGTGGTGAAKNAVQNGDYEAVVAIKGEIWCPEKGIDKKTNKTVGTKCDGGSFAHYYDCCGSGNAECCFALQLWVYITLGVITLISIISTIAGLLCCCCKK